MILTQIEWASVPDALARMEASLRPHATAHAVFQRIRVSGEESAAPVTDPAEQARDAVAFCRDWGFETVDAPPSEGFSWDGHAVWTQIEPSVLIHEVAHFQAASLERRNLMDFGLGAGPETGRKDEAEGDRALWGVACDIEEACASLLGILWEAELGQPALPAFLEQNWLEGLDRPCNIGHFLKISGLLLRHGLINDSGRPLWTVRQASDDEFFAGLITTDLTAPFHPSLSSRPQPESPKSP